jgi:hypothetical protein
MKSKDESSYIRIFSRIIRLVGTIKVEVVVVDFEIAIQNSILKILPNIEIYHCIFHFGKIVFRNLQRFGF